MVIRRFGVWSVAKLSAALYGGLGLIFGAIVALISMIGAGIASGLHDASMPNAGIMTSMFGVGAIIILPILYGIMGLIFGALTAALYNVVAGFVGGIQIETE